MRYLRAGGCSCFGGTFIANPCNSFSKSRVSGIRPPYSHRDISLRAESNDVPGIASASWLPWSRPSSAPDSPLTAGDALAQPLPEQDPLSIPVPVSLTLERPILSVAGGGRFFFWYLGVLKYLLEYYDLPRCTMIGASAGGLVIVLAASNVNLDRAVREAYRLSVENDIWSRPAGLAGIWGKLVRDWLDELLPPDADELCSGRVKLVVTEALTLRIRYVEDFRDRDDLIDAAMASIHIPFFLDGNATRAYRGQRYIDGSLWDFFSGKNSDLITCDGEACVIDYFFDDTLEYDRLDFVKLSSFEEVKALAKKGYAYAKRRDAAGGFDSTLGSVRKDLLTLAMEFPSRQLNRLLAET